MSKHNRRRSVSQAKERSAKQAAAASREALKATLQHDHFTGAKPRRPHK